MGGQIARIELRADHIRFGIWNNYDGSFLLWRDLGEDVDGILTAETPQEAQQWLEKIQPTWGCRPLPL